MTQRLNINKAKYFGENIDVVSFMNTIDASARAHGWRKEVYFKNSEFEFPAYIREVRADAPRVYISAGMHGDEPAAPLAVQKIIENDLLNNVNAWVCPVLNPMGLKLGTRENERGIDLNRDYNNPKTEEVKAHIAWIDKQPQFDLTLCLHEDWEAEGFYLLTKKSGPHSSLIIEAVKKVFPVDQRDVIESFPAHNGIVTPEIKELENGAWPEAFYLRKHGNGPHYTLEASSDYPLAARAEALVAGAMSVCNAISQE